jgi:hypothetical protein
MFEKRVLRRLFGTKRDEVTEEWRKLPYEEHNDPYSSPIIIWAIKSRRMSWEGHVAHMGARRGVYGVLVGKMEGKGPLGARTDRWEDNVKMDHQEVGWGAWTASVWFRRGTGGEHL